MNVHLIFIVKVTAAADRSLRKKEACPSKANKKKALLTGRRVSFSFFKDLKMSFVSSLRLLRAKRRGRGGHLGSFSFSTHLLSFESSGDERSDKVAVFLHGLMGTKKNWRTPVRLFQQRHPDFRCIAIDSRGHGDSAAVSRSAPIESHTLQNCAIDLDNFLNHMNISPSLLFGHSMVPFF